MRFQTCRFALLAPFYIDDKFMKGYFTVNTSVDIIEKDNIFLNHVADGKRPNMAIFLSGVGSNAEKLLAEKSVINAADPVVLITDAPEKSKAGAIGKKYNIPVEEFSIREFYRSHGLKSISLASAEGRRVRELWTDELRKRIKKYNIDFAVLAGFEPLSNITDDFPCLNVHPGDLSVVNSDGVRLYVGLHNRPVEAAILAGETTLRASVIIAQSFSNADKDMDNGLLLGVSQSMPIEFEGLTLDELKKIHANRPERKPSGGWNDALEALALRSQNSLKVCGDHVILPLVVRDFARKCFACQSGKLYYRQDFSAEFKEVISNEYASDGKRII